MAVTFLFAGVAFWVVVFLALVDAFFTLALVFFVALALVLVFFTAVFFLAVFFFVVFFLVVVFFLAFALVLALALALALDPDDFFFTTAFFLLTVFFFLTATAPSPGSIEVWVRVLKKNHLELWFRF
ncbi:hypothetical protein LQ236_002199 [Nitrospina gracilis]|uniref:hypothetical protein n=1 Tax=Nitrospina sp. Nb-3 TaxID=2940485 RepID=UPI001F31236B|nr:hypothetical protein [Nitrospina sp. Nb-3]MCF8724179.1 hypothetical protein [Nitrospina sp. Nb-3]